MAKRKYIFTNKRHSTEAIGSVILGTVSLLGMIAAIYLSFREAGGTKPGYGLTGFLAVLFSLVGLILGILSFRKNDSFLLLCWMGTILNLLVLIGTGFIFSLGLS